MKSRHSSMFLLAFSATALLFSPACVVTNRDIESLREQVQTGQKDVTELRTKLDEHTLRLDGVENQIQMLETRVDDNTTRIEDLKAGMIVESSPASVRPALTPPSPVAEPATAPPEIKEPPAYSPRTYIKGEDLYNSAYSHFEKGEYGQAILEFEEYVANYGKTELADNAQYWIGECYYAQKDYRQAIREFDKVEKNFPSGNKVPAAKIKKGLALREVGNNEEAVKELKDVIGQFPDAEEALLAKEKLKLWK